MSNLNYEEKIRDMQKYIPFLKNLITKLQNNKDEKPREAQLNKMQMLYSLLTNKEKRLKIETLLKCETVLIKLYNKVEKNGAYAVEQKETNINDNLPAPASPPSSDIVHSEFHAPIVIPTERRDTPSPSARSHHSNSSSINIRKDVLESNGRNKYPDHARNLNINTNDAKNAKCELYRRRSPNRYDQSRYGNSASNRFGDDRNSNRFVDNKNRTKRPDRYDDRGHDRSSSKHENEKYFERRQSSLATAITTTHQNQRTHLNADFHHEKSIRNVINSQNIDDTDSRKTEDTQSGNKSVFRRLGPKVDVSATNSYEHFKIKINTNKTKTKTAPLTADVLKSPPLTADDIDDLLHESTNSKDKNTGKDKNIGKDKTTDREKNSGKDKSIGDLEIVRKKLVNEISLSKVKNTSDKDNNAELKLADPQIRLAYKYNPHPRRSLESAPQKVDPQPEAPNMNKPQDPRINKPVITGNTLPGVNLSDPRLRNRQPFVNENPPISTQTIPSLLDINVSPPKSMITQSSIYPKQPFFSYPHSHGIQIGNQPSTSHSITKSHSISSSPEMDTGYKKFQPMINDQVERLKYIESKKNKVEPRTYGEYKQAKLAEKQKEQSSDQKQTLNDKEDSNAQSEKSLVDGKTAKCNKEQKVSGDENPELAGNKEVIENKELQKKDNTDSNIDNNETEIQNSVENTVDIVNQDMEMVEVVEIVQSTEKPDINTESEPLKEDEEINSLKQNLDAEKNVDKNDENECKLNEIPKTESEQNSTNIKLDIIEKIVHCKPMTTIEPDSVINTSFSIPKPDEISEENIIVGKRRSRRRTLLDTDDRLALNISKLLNESENCAVTSTTVLDNTEVPASSKTIPAKLIDMPDVKVGSKKEEITKEWLEGFLLNLFNPAFMNKSNFLVMLEKVLDRNKFEQISKILQDTDEELTETKSEEKPAVISNNDNNANVKDTCAKIPDKITEIPKRKTELDRLNEDIRNMFICQGVLTATGRRMCTIINEEKKSTSTVNKQSKIQPNKTDVIEPPRTRQTRQSSHIVINKPLSTPVRKKVNSPQRGAKGRFSKSKSKKKNASAVEKEVENNVVENEHEKEKEIEIMPDIIELKKDDSADTKKLQKKKRKPCPKSKKKPEDLSEDENEEILEILIKSSNVIPDEMTIKKAEDQQEMNSNTSKHCEKNDTTKVEESFDEQDRSILATFAECIHNNSEDGNAEKELENTLFETNGSFGQGIVDQLNTSFGNHAIEEISGHTNTKVKKTRNRRKVTVTSDHPLEFKNVRPDMHSQSIHSQKCTLCDFSGRYLSNHYAHIHPYSEVLISRLPPQALEDLKENRINDALDIIQKRAKKRLYQYQCPFCDVENSFTRKGWIEHFGTHTGEYTFKCSDCSRVLNLKLQIIRHIKKSCPKASIIRLRSLMGDPKQIYAYVCTLCSYIQMSRDNIVKHLLTQHETNDDLIIRISLLNCRKRLDHLEKSSEKPNENQLDVFMPQENDDLKLDKNFMQFMSEISFSSGTTPTRSTLSVADRINERFKNAIANEHMSTLSHNVHNKPVSSVQITSITDRITEKFRIVKEDQNKTESLMPVNNTEVNSAMVLTDIGSDNVENVPEIVTETTNEIANQLPQNELNSNDAIKEIIHETVVESESEVDETANDDDDWEDIEILPTPTNFDNDSKGSTGSGSNITKSKKNKTIYETLSRLYASIVQPRSKTSSTKKDKNSSTRNIDDASDEISENNRGVRCPKTIKLDNETINSQEDKVDQSDQNNSMMFRSSGIIHLPQRKVVDPFISPPKLNLKEAIAALVNNNVTVIEQTIKPGSSKESSQILNDCDNISNNTLQSEIIRVCNLGFSKRSTEINFHCLIENCKFLNTDLPIVLKNHFTFDHPHIVWNAYCNICKAKVESDDVLSLTNEFNHMLEKHLYSERNNEGISEESTLPPQKPLIKIRRLSGDMLSSKKPEIKISNAKTIVSQNPILTSYLIKESTLECDPTYQPLIISSVSGGSVQQSPTSELKITNVTGGLPLDDFVTPSTNLPLKIKEVISLNSDIGVRESTKVLKPWTKSLSAKTLNIREKLLTEESLFATFKCMGNDCTFTTNQSVLMNEHLKYHASNSRLLKQKNAWLECAYCSSWSASIEQLILHVETKHKYDIYICSYCFYRSCEGSNVFFHLNEYHKTNEKIVNVCDGEKLLINNEIREINRSRINNVRSLKCFDCPAQFYIIQNYERHIASHDIYSYLYKCGVCRVRVAKTSVNKHLLLHHCIGLYECIYCPFASDNVTTLQSHMANRHPSNLLLICIRVAAKDITSNISETIFNATKLASLSQPTDELNCTRTYTANPIKNPMIIQTSTDFQISQVQSISTEDFNTNCANQNLSNNTNLSDIMTYSELMKIEENNSEGQKELPRIELAESVSNDDILQKNETNTDNALVTVETEVNQPTTTETPSQRLERVAREIVQSTGLEGEQLYRCGYQNCNEASPDSITFNVHMLKHTSDKLAEYCCYHCKNVFKTIVSLKCHLRSHATHKFFCYACDITGSSLNVIVKHMTDAHSKQNLGSYPLINGKFDKNQDFFIVCPRNNRAVDLANYGEHLIKMWERKKSLMKKYYKPDEIDQLPRQAIFFDELFCAICKYRTKVRTNIIRHLQFHKQEVHVASVDPVNPVPCLKTNEKHFDKMLNLACSSNINKKDKNNKSPIKHEMKCPEYISGFKRFVCGVPGCKYLTINETMMKWHLHTLHSTEKSYKCPHCNLFICKNRLSADKIVQHLKYHDSKLFQCDTCFYIHYQKSVIDRHFTDKHPHETVQLLIFTRDSTNVSKSIQIIKPANINLETPKTNPFKWECALCKIRTTTRNEIIKHMNDIHKIKKQYQCSNCNFSAHLIQHITDHATEKHPSKVTGVRSLFHKTPENVEQDLSTTPLWRRTDPNRIKNIRGILMEEEDESNVNNFNDECNKLTDVSEEEEVNESKSEDFGVEAECHKLTSESCLCHMCSYVGSSKASTERHIIEVHSQALPAMSLESLIKYQCFHCIAKYKSVAKVYEHWEKRHKTIIDRNTNVEKITYRPFLFVAIKLVACALCFLTGLYSNLVFHYSHDHPNRNLAFTEVYDLKKCSHCEFKFSENVEELLEHFQKEHAPEVDQRSPRQPPYNVSESILNRILTEGTQQNMFRCLICSYTYNTRDEYRSHHSGDHGHIKQTFELVQNKVLFACYICQFASPRQEGTIRHIYNHFTIYECDECKHKCRKLKDLNAHNKKYHKKKKLGYKTVNIKKEPIPYDKMRIVFPNGFTLRKSQAINTRYGDTNIITKTIENLNRNEVCKSPNFLDLKLLETDQYSESESINSCSTTSSSRRKRVISDKNHSISANIKNIDEYSSEDEYKPSKPKILRTYENQNSTSKILENTTPITEPYSFYGIQPEPIDLSKIGTIMNIGGSDVRVTCDRFSKLVKIKVYVKLEKLNLDINKNGKRLRVEDNEINNQGNDLSLDGLEKNSKRCKLETNI